MITRRPSPLPFLIGLTCLGVLGCGGGQAPETAESGGDKAKSNSGLPTVSIGGPKAAGKQELEEGSPDWILSEIRKVRAEKLPPQRIIDEKKKTDKSPPDETDEEYAERLSTIRRDRNDKIVTLATAAITKTHEDPAQEASFTAAVHQLMEARLQLALGGEKDDVDGLYEDVATLEKSKPKSKAAAEAAFIRARFAHMNAQRFAETEPRWLEEFAKQARLFASQYPGEETRGSMLLHAAGWSCELHRMTDEAVACYNALVTQFPNAPQASQAEAAARRMQLKGQPLELAGPTPDGGFTRLEDFAGKSVLVVFWASDAADFEEQLKQIQEISTKYAKYGLAVVGVNLDEDEADLTAFTEKHSLQWPQIFHPDPQQRRWNNPVVKHYGVRDIPAVWLVDHKGLVVDTQVDVANLEKDVRAVLSKQQQASR